MSTSGDTTWQLNRDQIIAAALRKVGFAEGEVPNANQISYASDALNALIQSWRADGMPVWAMKTYSFTTIANQQTYDIGVGKTLATPMPLKLTEAVRVNTTGGNRVPLNIYTDYDFKLLSNFQNAVGTPVQIYYQPFSTYGTIHLWPLPDSTFSSGNTIEITYQRPFEDFDNATDEPDFPSYWTRAIIWGLANELSEEYGIPAADAARLEKKAEKAKDLALSYGTEEGSIKLMPDWTMMFDMDDRGGGY